MCHCSGDSARILAYGKQPQGLFETINRASDDGRHCAAVSQRTTDAGSSFEAGEAEGGAEEKRAFNSA
jgi:hypothetical protein